MIRAGVHFDVHFYRESLYRESLLPKGSIPRQPMVDTRNAQVNGIIKTLCALIQVVSAPKVGRDLAEFQFPLAVDFCPGVSHVAIAWMFSGNDQVVGDHG